MATDPGTRSPGHIFLRYDQAGHEHTVSARLVTGVSLDNITLLRGEAVAWAVAAANCMPGTHNITSWGIRDNSGVVVYSEPFDAPYTGEHGTGEPNWLSKTLYFEGRGNSIGAGSASGRMGFRLFVGGAFPNSPGGKVFPVAGDPALGDMKTTLDGSTVIFADFYGQKGDMGTLCPVQWNAAAQRRLGC